MQCDSCREKIQRELAPLPGVRIETIDVAQQRLVLRLAAGDGAPGAWEIQELLEKRLQLNTIIRGAGDFVAAVSQVRGSNRHPAVVGVCRFVQNAKRQCLVDAVVDGLAPGVNYNVGVHQYGDLSQEADLASIGEEVRPVQHAVATDSNGRLALKTKLEDFDLVAAIGQSLGIGTGDEVVAAGIVARASKILDNVKKVCACSGRTLWQERETNRI